MRSTERTFCPECKLFTFEHKHVKVDEAVAPVVHKLIKSTPYGKLGKPAKVRSTFLLFDCDVVPALSMANIVVQAQWPVRMKRLVVDPLIAPFFRLHDIKIGCSSEMANYSSTGVGCSIFPPDRRDEDPINNLEGTDLVHVGQNITLQISNVDAGACHSFNAMIYADKVSGLTDISDGDIHA